MLGDTAVVMLHFGSSPVTATSLEALRQSYPDPQFPRVFLVENGTPFEGRENFSGVTWIALPKNLGYGGGNNRGLRAALDAGARFVILLNNDVHVVPGAFEAMRRAAESPTVGLVGLPLEESQGVVWGGGRVSWWTGKAQLALEPTAPGSLDYIHGACVGLTRAVLERVGMLREDFFLYWEDVDYGLRARQAGFTFAVADTVPLRHRSRSRTAGAAASKTYYLVRNAVYLMSEQGTLPVRWWMQMLNPLRQWVATLRGKQVVVRALQDAARGVIGPAPIDL